MSDPGCACWGSGVILVEGPCDAAPVEAPCKCLGRLKITDGMIERAAKVLNGAAHRSPQRWHEMRVIAANALAAALSSETQEDQP